MTTTACKRFALYDLVQALAMCPAYVLESEVYRAMSTLGELRQLLRLRALQRLTLVTLLASLGWYGLRLKVCILDLDIWWHLKVGNWIVQNRAVPHAGILSRSAATMPWVAYSWGYEVLLSRAYSWFGLVGVGLLGIFLTLAVAYTVFWMLFRLSRHFWGACVLATITCSAFLFNLLPRPVFLSMVLFMVALTLILEAQRSKRIQTLYWLPPIFVLWANVHIQFIYGLFLLGLLLGVNLLGLTTESLKIKPAWLCFRRLPIQPLAAVFAASILGTCIGPYSFRLYQVIYQYSTAQLPYALIQELQPINFRFADHYVQLLLTATGFFAVGWQKKIDPFKLALLIIASVVAYRTMRDSWFICVVAAACIADTVRATESEADRPASRLEMAGLGVVLMVILLLLARNEGFTERGLDDTVSGSFPVRAVNFVRQSNLPGPLYNSFDWGGFLIWYLPDYPVVIDGRNDLYGDELDRRFVAVENGDASYATEPYLDHSGIVLLRKGLLLADRLNNDPRFRLIYEDQLAVVFVRQ
jgi:hypothetical protein